MQEKTHNPLTRGARLLAEWREKQGLSVRGLAKLCECSAFSIYNYESGERLPRLDIAGKIRAVTGGTVQLDDWLIEA